MRAQVEIIQGLPQEAIISLYRCGPMVDLCHGPHLPNTGYIKAHAVHNMSRAFWRADVKKEPLQVPPQSAAPERRPRVGQVPSCRHDLSGSGGRAGFRVLSIHLDASCN